MKAVLGFAIATAAGVVGLASPLVIPMEAQAQSNCVTLVNNHTFANGCSRAVFVSWVDQGYCRSGCGTGISPESYAGITAIQGRACWAVGWYPNAPHPVC
jgi:hypothetical protein